MEFALDGGYRPQHDIQFLAHDTQNRIWRIRQSSTHREMRLEKDVEIFNYTLGNSADIAVYKVMTIIFVPE